MLKKRRKKALEEGHTNNIWNRHDFVMCGLGEKSRTLAIVKHVRKCIKWSKQRIVRGYADSDIWNMYGYLQVLLPDMLEYLKNHRCGSPGYLGEKQTKKHALKRIHTKRSIGKLSMNSEINMVYLGKNFRHRKNWKPTENEAAVELSTL